MFDLTLKGGVEGKYQNDQAGTASAACRTARAAWSVPSTKAVADSLRMS